jgi:CheY-like chemotaxis protein
MNAGKGERAVTNIKSAVESSAKAKTASGEREMPRILIVEDEPNMVAGLRDNFEFEGYHVITAPDGIAGLERALNEAPDLVILDVMMPRMSGLDVCKQLKSKRPSIPVIMLTARGTGRGRLCNQAIFHPRAFGSGESRSPSRTRRSQRTGLLCLRRR